MRQGYQVQFIKLQDGRDTCYDEVKGYGSGQGVSSGAYNNFPIKF